ncbi:MULTISPECIES: hypothetical protein [unclassified Haloarcula]|jgi:hypothetical protein|uniref:hypothetical protein n=1 Tax=Haloarcula sp. K1 TaxID=1622207 RepID=UPI0007BBC34E|nr:hypothetical protein [Haloarcula sp. K1]KZX46202.1 hypothetical protein AV929_15630 [Haloarcula sp. K1]
MKFGLEPRFDREELKALSDDKLIELQQYAQSNLPHQQTYTEADYQMMLDEIKERFKMKCEAESHFGTELTDLQVGDEAGLIEIESRSGYIRIAIERTPSEEADRMKLQVPSGNNAEDYTDEELIATAGRWFSRHATWEDFATDT